MRDRFPKPVLTSEQEDVVNVHQLWAGHWGLVRSYLHRIGRHPTRSCQQCGDLKCPAALCEVCREEADTPAHVLLRCPAWRAHDCAFSGPYTRTRRSCGLAGP